MRVALYIVISIVIILGMVVDANATRGVHREYLRRRQASSQSRFNIFHEPPAGVHAEYIRRWIHGQYAVKIPHALHVRAHRKQPTSRVRPHIRQHRRNKGNIHI